MSDDALTGRERAIQRARSVKAFKLARVLAVTDIDVMAFRGADQQFREYVAEHAGVNSPSDVSWQLACDMLDAMRDE